MGCGWLVGGSDLSVCLCLLELVYLYVKFGCSSTFFLQIHRRKVRAWQMNIHMPI
ncbi:hypothetical protein RchiOBHm_Chr7g0210401 [Rosa chinensis]|uniref:Uncharacterized protein n=1 Tax=Rosa chinensis TaxID=74649 RepID=A0A2P6PA73_ROSCH|nr:hypothetical protein RchiOBHm_Chr7g0210401 [Rosa chinensis]